MTTTLICTVGGSHQPIVRAIEELVPDHVCFICSGDDPATGSKGSHIQVTGKGNVIKAHFKDETPSLPNIPAQAGLRAEQVEVIKVSPDDFDDIYGQVIGWLCRRDLQADRVVADYTGGTKTMSAALAVAALDCEGVELQLVSGSRSNLIKVESGGEQVMAASVETSRFRRRLDQAVSAWNRYAYEETAAMLTAMKPPRDANLRGEYQRALEVSRALAAWDRFDHHSAFSILARYKAKVGKALGLHLKALAMLNEENAKRREPLQLYDLWLNAQRRAAQGRYDDAIARVYRLIEWLAQWQLRTHAAITTDDIPEDKIPDTITLNKNREGIYQAGLYQSWQLVAALLDNPAATFFKANDKKMLDHLLIRNHSILAHGFKPIEKDQWNKLAAWMESAFIPMLTTLANEDGEIRFSIDRLQLPRDYDELAPGDDNRVQ